MASYGVAEAKNNFTHLLDRVQGGEKITITRHGKPIAELSPSPRLTVEKRSRLLVYPQQSWFVACVMATRSETLSGRERVGRDPDR